MQVADGSRRSRSTWASARRKTDAKQLDAAIEELTIIAGQRAQVRRARKSIAQFKIREGMPIGAKVTLRGDRMWEFLDRLVSIALPRIRDFRGLNPRLVRRPRQLLARHPRADHLPRDRLRQHQPDPRPRRRDHDHCRDRRAGARAAARRSACRSRPRHGGSRTRWRRSRWSSRPRGPQKFKVRNYTRCNRCGRPRAVFKKFGLCRICLRELAHQGVIPGMTKSSW